ncbi:hypothetical protein [Gulosibacter molinativorax]|uniref:Uncharacterized protein n=1 Tax=Gulosibacter molinativorax TaxID=256821 RepID=A0ABT7C637_9MICO|nr:hypothetical protein [Gulosibacter molinativorax]MDJ1370672.1 hypothetical protein [Gulosibacter molinativorax]QUY63301.1 Hypotetical protein [Gulosibacter molinativorax]
MRLYKAHTIDKGNYEEDEYGFPVTEPEGWREYALEKWGTLTEPFSSDDLEYREFFWPSDDQVYRSLSEIERIAGALGVSPGSLMSQDFTISSLAA